MKTTATKTTATMVLLLLIGSMASWLALHAAEPATSPAEVKADSSATSDALPPPTSVSEASARARLLYESFHGTLQVVHRDFFDEDESRLIPSQSLEDVFIEMSKGFDVDMKWLVVETDVVNVDHQPEDDFEKAAVVALKDGQPRFEAVEGDRFRFAGPIRLASQCLKCHVQKRTSTDARKAGLLISMPINLSE